MYATLFDDPDLINRMLDRYLAVDAAAVLAVSEDVFQPDNRVVLTYLPEMPPADDASDDDASDDDASVDDASDDEPASRPEVASPPPAVATYNPLLVTGVPLVAVAILMGVYWLILRWGAV